LKNIHHESIRQKGYTVILLEKKCGQKAEKEIHLRNSCCGLYESFHVFPSYNVICKQLLMPSYEHFKITNADAENINLWLKYLMTEINKHLI